MAEEKIGFTRTFLVLGNLGLLAWIFIAFFGVLFYNQIYGWVYLVFDAFMVYAILRRLGCSNCYRCKTCTSGFGRLAGAFFGRGFIKKKSVGKRIEGVVAFIYFLLFPLPAGVLFLSTMQNFSFLKVLVLICILAFTIYSLTTWQKPSKVNH